MFKEGDIFEGLTLLKHCGSGAFGDVFFCRDISGKEMAVKIISKKQIGEYWERELQGVTNYRKITDNAPELLQIYHVRDNEDYFYYTMEPADSVSKDAYIPDTLGSRLQKGALPEKELYPILSKVFKGIKLIHDNHFVHRDIKPDNILFVNGVPKLADIGLFSSLTVTVTQMAGTLDYIPPEVRSSTRLFTSMDREERQRNDLYALGMVIYCSVTGLSPEKYPSIPADISLNSPAVKYFWKLSRDLCCANPQQRISTMDELFQEFYRIRKNLSRGETWAGESNHVFNRLWRFLKDLFCRTGTWLSKYAWLVISLIVLVMFFCFQISEKKMDAMKSNRDVPPPSLMNRALKYIPFIKN